MASESVAGTQEHTGAASPSEGVTRVAAVLMALVFVVAGTVQVLGVPFVVEAFQGWDYPLWLMHSIGVAELCAAMLLLWSRTASGAAVALSIIMAGAVLTHMMLGDGIITLLPLVLLAVLLGLAGRSGKLKLGAWSRAEAGDVARVR